MKQIFKIATGIGLALALQSYAFTAQTIGAVTGGPTMYAASGTSTLSATASSSLTVTFTSTTEDVCTVSGTAVTTVGIGTCTIKADQAGDATYSAAPQTSTDFVVVRATQTLSGNPSTLGTPTYGSSFTLVVLTGGASGNPVVLTSGSPSVCIVSGIFVLPLDGGNCIVNADQAGNTYYAQATQTTHTFVIAPETQTISAISGGPSVYGTTSAILATTNSPIPVVYGTSTGAVCSVNSSTGYVLPLKAGTCTVTATNAGNSMWTSVAATPVDLNIALAPQTLSPINGLPTVFSASTTTLSAPASLSSGAGTWSSSTGTVCTIVAGTGVLSIVAPGTCTITYTSAADNFYAQSTSTTTSVIAKAPQTITGWTVTGTPTYGSPFTVSATGGASSSALAYASTTPGVCAVNATTGVVTPATSGICTITTNQAADANYLAAPTITNNVTIALASQTIGAIASTNNSPVFGGGTFTVSASATSGNTVVFNSLTPAVCTNVLGVITPVTQGTCTIAANQAGDSKYAAAPQKTRSIVIDFANQTIGAITGGPTVYGTSTTVSATATSALPVTFASLTSSVCTIAAGSTTVVPVKAGTCMVSADQGGDSRYNAAPTVTASFTIAKASQTIAPILGGPTAYQGTGAVTTSATSGYAVVLTSLTPSVCTLSGSTSGSTVTAVGVGSCIIAADQAGDAKYSAATEVTTTLTIAALSQTIGTITTGATPTYGTPFTVSASGGASGNSIIFSTSSPACVVSGTTVTPVTAGTCTIKADQAGNALYNAASQDSANFAIALATNSISAIAGGPSVYPTTATVGATATSGGAITFTSTTPLVCTVAGIVVTPVSGGTCTIKASVAADTKYTAVQTTQNFTISPAAQFIGAITTTGTPTFGVGFTVAATATSGLATTFTSTTPSVCSVNSTSGLVTPVKSGACTIKADQAGDSKYSAAASVTNSFTIANASQAISLFSSLPATIPYDGTAQVSAYGGGSGNAVSFGSNSPLVCSVSSGGALTPTDAGTCVVTANQAGGTNYDAAPQTTINVTITKAAQAIVWSSTTNPATPTLGTPFTVSVAGGGSGQPVVLSSLTGSVCSVSGFTVTPVSAGTCTLHAIQTFNSKYSAATPVDHSFAIAPTTQTISAISGGPSVFGVTAAVTATTSSGLALTWASTTTGVCSVDASGNVTPVTAGSCNITADQGGNSNYGAATQVHKTWTIAKAAQTIGAITTATATPTYGTQFTVAATATSGIATTFTSNSPGVCSVNATTGVVTPVASGTCTIQADQVGDARYLAVSPSQTQDFTIVNKSQAITFANPGAQPYGVDFTVSGTGGASGKPVVFASTTPLTCSTSGTNGTTIHPLAQGTCTITANQAGDAGFYDPAPQVSNNITISLAPQTIVWSTSTSVPPTYGATFNVSATGGSSGHALTFSAASSSVCTVVDNGNNTATITPVDVGACTVNANQAGNTQYSAATQTVSPTFTILQSAQSIGSITGGPTVYGTPAAVTATASSNLAVTWTTADASFCSVGSTTGLVTPAKSGSCKVYANQAGNTKYLAAPQDSVILSIAKEAQTIGAVTGGPTVWGTNGTLSATATSGNTVVFTTSTPLVCSVSGTTVTPVIAGSCIIKANEPGDTKWAAASEVSQTFVITLKPQTITNIATGPSAFGVAVNLSTTATSGLPVTFVSATPLVCTIAGSIVTPKSSGTCTITTDQAGDSKWAAAPQISQNFTIGKAAQTIEAIAGGPTVFGAPATVSTTSTSGLNVTFTSHTPTVCTSSGTFGSVITPVKAGTCTIYADQAGDNSFAAASRVTANLTIDSAAQTIGTISTVSTPTFGATFTVTATGGSSGLPVIFTSTTTGVCTVSGTNGSVVTPVSVGKCTIAANQAGDSSYKVAVTKTQDFTIIKASQTIPTLTAPSSAPFGTPITVSVTASSNLAVTFTDSTPGVCTVMNSASTPVNTSAFNATTHLSTVTVTPVSVGTCYILANQAGTANYNAATEVKEDILINATTDVINPITLTAITPTFGAPDTAKATTLSGLPVTFASTTTDVCTIGINDGVITVVKAGTCAITADRVSSSGFGAASQVTKTFAIAKANQTIAAITGGPTSYGEVVTMPGFASSGLPVLYASLTPLVCSVTHDSVVTAVDFGSCQLTVNQSGDGRYNAAPTVISSAMTIATGVQTITSFTPTTTTPVYGATFGVSASGGGSGQPVTFSTATTTICSVSGSTITAKNVGSCVIDADQAGNVRYAAATQAHLTVVIGQAHQTVAALTNGPSGYLDTVKLAATTSKTTTNSFTYSTITAATICKVSHDTVFATGIGYCAVKAVEAGDTKYFSDSVVTTFQIGKHNQTLIPITVMPTTFKDTTVISTLSYTDTTKKTLTGATPITYTSMTPNVCVVIVGTGNVKVAAKDVGTCTVKADQVGNSNYQAGTVSTSSVIGSATQTVVKPTITTAKYLDTVALVSTTNSGLTGFTYLVTTSSICKVGSTLADLNKLYPLDVGTCKFVAIQAGNSQWKADTSDTASVTITQRPQTIGTLAGGPATYHDSAAVTGSATSGLALTYSTTTAAVCSVLVSQKVYAKTAGACIIMAKQAGDSKWLKADSITQTFTIAKKNQTIASIVGAPTRYGDTALVASTASSGLVTTFTSASPTICTVVSNTSKVVGILPGNCILKSNQVGDGNWAAAPTFTDTFPIARAPLAIKANPVLKYYGGVDTLTWIVDNSQSLGDTIYKGDKLAGALARDAGDSVALYTIRQGTLTDSLNPKYHITYTAAAMNIIRKPVIVTADSVTKVYGAADPTKLTFKVSPALKTGDTLHGAMVRETGDSVGTYGINQGTLDTTRNKNYLITYVGNNFKITRLPITVTADTLRKVYGTMDPTAFTYKTAPALIGADVLHGALSRKSGEKVGLYAVTQGNLDTVLNKNYKITFVSKNFAIGLKPITVTATAKSIVYGTPDTLKWTSVPALVGTDTMTGALTRKAGTAAGTYAITQGTLANANYKITFVSNNLVITPMPITVTAVDTNKIYGSLDPKFTFVTTPTKLIGSDVLKGTLSRAAGTSVAGSPYAITQGTVTDSANPNYTITYVGKALTIKRKALTITADTLTKIYGDTTFALTFKATGLVAGDTVAGALTRHTNGWTKGTYAIDSNSITTTANPNYTVKYVPHSLRIMPKSLTVAAKAQSYVFGDAAALDTTKLACTATGYVLGDTFTTDKSKGWLSRDAGSAAGKYAIRIGAFKDTNYAITFTTAFLTITQRPISIHATRDTVVYGTPDTLKYTIVPGANDSAMVGSDTLTGKLARKAGTTVGKYNITVGSLANKNYVLHFVPETLLVVPKPITVKAKGLTKIYGAANPAYTFTAAGLVGADALKGALTREAGEGVGTFKILQNTLKDSANPNYTITFVPDSLLTITKRLVTVTPKTLSKVFGATDPTLTYTATGLSGTDVLSGTLHRATGENKGTYAIDSGSITTAANANYTVKFTSGVNFTVTAAPVKIVMGAFTKASDATADPDFSASPTVITGLVGSDALTGTFSRAAGSAVGKYAITLGSVTAGSNYSITFVTNYLTITKPIARYMMANDGTAPTISNIAGETMVYDMKGSLVWNGNMELGSVGAIENALQPGRYVVKNRAVGSFIWFKQQ